jgi:hypothetical protein
MLSISPPGGNGTTSLMGRAGQLCAPAGMATESVTAAQAVANAIQFLRCITIPDVN